MLAARAGWLVLAMANQLSDSPPNSSTPATGLYLTWSFLVIALVGTVAMALQRRAAPQAGSPDALAKTRTASFPPGQIPPGGIPPGQIAPSGGMARPGQDAEETVI